ncbi:hypothetical protein FQR65_LT04530 [Abscondita terminalis]|nr:hypothetical protein FQR65_LT04530 [Abscondita terminalis]
MSNGPISIPDHLQNLIYKILKEHGMSGTISMKGRQPLKPGANWLGQILEIEAVGGNPQNQEKTLIFIAKMAPTIKLYRDFFPIRLIYEREIYMYNTIIPEFLKVQKQLNVMNFFAPFVHCYATNFEEEQEIVLLENMFTLGYRSIGQHLPVDYQHASLIMKACGKLHALSFVIKDHKPELFEEMRNNTKEIFMSSGLRESFLELIMKLGTKVLNYLEKDSKVYKAFETLLKHSSFFIDIPQCKADGEYAVIAHGDYEIRNMLFKYEDKVDDSSPTDLCLLDWQLSVFANPMVDVSIFIWICTDQKLRDQHYFDLIESYYDSFSSFLLELGGDLEKSYPRTVFDKHLKQYSAFEQPNFSEAIDFTDMVKILSENTNETYLVRIKEIVEDFIKYDYNFDGGLQ